MSRTPGRDWRLRIGASKDYAYMRVSELAFLDASGADLCVGGQAGASSVYSGDYGAGNAFDKSPDTDWWSNGNGAPFWLAYRLPAPAVVAQLRLRLSPRAGQSIPPDAQALELASEREICRLQLASGSFAAGELLVLDVVGALPITLGGLPGPDVGLQGRPACAFAGLAPMPVPERLAPNFLRPNAPATGQVQDYMMLRASASAPEQPFANGRVWLLRAADGAKVWEGYTDQSGAYCARGLELGVAHIAVGIDPSGAHQAGAGGPVLATLSGGAP
jgi:hypothetical protein